MKTTGIAVIGAGPAGIAAALAASEAGAAVTLIDENPSVGGQLRWRITALRGLGDGLDGLPACQAVERLEERLAAADVSVLTNAVAWGLFEDGSLAVATPGGGDRRGEFGQRGTDRDDREADHQLRQAEA